MAVALLTGVVRRKNRTGRRTATPRRGLFELCLGVTVVLLAVTCGCTREVAMRDVGPEMMQPADRARTCDAVVFGSPEMIAAVDLRGVSSEDVSLLARRNAALVARAPATTFEQDTWRSPTRPTLDRTRRVFIQQRPENVIFFRDERVRDRSTTGGVWGR